MDNLFFLLFLASPILFFAGLIKPKSFSNKFPRANLNRKRLSLIFFALFIISAFGFDATYVSDGKEELQVIGESTEIEVSNQEESIDTVLVTRVIDGDTVETQGGNKIRYIGVDAPEPAGDECYSEKSTKRNEELVEGKKVRLEKDVSELDPYERLLRYLWVGETMINEILVREGYAKVSTYPPDVKYQEKFHEAEKLAREEGLGLWGDVCTPTEAPTRIPAKVPTLTPKPVVKSNQNQYIQPTPTNNFPPTAYPTSSYVQPTNLPENSGSSGGSCKYDCSGPDRDCADFSTHSEAQTFFNCCGFTATNDPMRLDGWGNAVDDGIACESLP